MPSEVDPFYPFPVVYAEIKAGSEWLAYDDNWTDGFIHRVFLIDGVFYEKQGVSYDGIYTRAPLTPCRPNMRMALPAIPYIAEYKKKDGKLFCPNGHDAGYNYPFPGCRANCPFYRCRQHNYAELSGVPWYRDRVKMRITINGQAFDKRVHN